MANGSSSAVYSVPSVTYAARDGRDGLLIFMIETRSSSLNVDTTYVKPSISAYAALFVANRLLSLLSSTDVWLGELGSVMFMIVKSSPSNPKYMELSIWNASMYAGVVIESKPFAPFSIIPNGDMTRFGMISNE